MSIEEQPFDFNPTPEATAPSIPQPELVSPEQLTTLTDATMDIRAKALSLVGQTVGSAKEGFLSFEGDEDELKIITRDPRVVMRRDTFTIRKDVERGLTVDFETQLPALEDEAAEALPGYSGYVVRTNERIPLLAGQPATYIRQVGSPNADGSLSNVNVDNVRVHDVPLKSDKATQLQVRISGWNLAIDQLTRQQGDHGRTASRASQTRTAGFLGRIIRRDHGRN